MTHHSRTLSLNSILQLEEDSYFFVDEYVDDRKQTKAISVPTPLDFEDENLTDYSQSSSVVEFADNEVFSILQQYDVDGSLSNSLDGYSFPTRSINPGIM